MQRNKEMEWNHGNRPSSNMRAAFFVFKRKEYFMSRIIKSDIEATLRRDPAARSKLEVILCYPGIHAIMWHRVSHYLFNHNMKLLARIISQSTRFWTGIEIHPGAKIGGGFFIDHGMGVVIGETCEIGDNVTIYQGVTLGGTGKDVGKRHPTIGDDVMVGTGASVLGPFTVGEGAKIGAGAIVLEEVPPKCTVAGNPGRLVRCCGKKIEFPKESMDQVHLPDPIELEFVGIRERLVILENEQKARSKK